MAELTLLDRRVRLDAAAIAATQDEIAAMLRLHGVEEIPASRVRLVIEELSANLIMHGRFEGERPPLRIAVALTVAEVLVRLEDAAAPFDPRLTEAPPAPGLDDDRIGGLGLPLVRKMATIRDYRRLDSGWNRTEVAVARNVLASG